MFHFILCFSGDAYKDHVKCISENEKYGGKNYKAPVGKGNKGEAKQEQWLQVSLQGKSILKIKTHKLCTSASKGCSCRPAQVLHFGSKNTNPS